ncbi:MAG TPA: SDR family oxidoreductase [Anaerolineaceae bacterium]|nr:SDR family oxidoreductase [Anaerolineaceae bacterium]
MDYLKLANQVALVTGASSGLGADFARELASRGASVILVARREDQLRAVAAEIEKDYGVSAQVIALDLASPDAPQVLYDLLHQQGIQVDVLVNNAGFGIYGDFASIPWEREKAMLELDILVLTHMTKLFLPDMLARKSGFILQVASIGAFQPSPTYATYSAAKAYVLSMGEAINYELRHSGVSLTVISPGVTATEFLKVAGQSPSLYQRMMMMDSRKVARIGVDSMLRRRSSVVPGFFNSLAAFSTRLMPRRLQAALANLFMTRN